MKRSCIIALLVFTAGIGAPAIAEEPDAAVTAKAGNNTSGKVVKEKKFCRSEKITGTRTKVNRVCRTRAEWDQIAEATRKNMNDFNREVSGTAAPTAKNPFGPG